MLVAFAAFKKHVSLFALSSTSLLNKYAAPLKSYKTSTGTLQFPFGTKIPATFLKKLIKARMKENVARLK